MRNKFDKNKIEILFRLKWVPDEMIGSLGADNMYGSTLDDDGDGNTSNPAEFGWQERHLMRLPCQFRLYTEVDLSSRRGREVHQFV